MVLGGRSSPSSRLTIFKLNHYRTPSQQIVKLRPAIGTHMNDLAIQHSGWKRLSESRTELCKRFVDVPFARYQLHVAILYVGQRPEAIVFQFKQPIGMVERHM